jgi:23S rRNA (adenine2503-C2)-methyltransferase
LPISTKTFLLDLKLDELKAELHSMGEKPFRAKQIYDSIYKKFADSFEEIKGLPKNLRVKLKENISFSHLQPQIDLLSSDGWTRKILFNLPDKAQVETVLMGYGKRRTACISTQAGCGLGCTFCATGQAGLQRNISAGEIVEQVLFFERVSPTLTLPEGEGMGKKNLLSFKNPGAKKSINPSPSERENPAKRDRERSGLTNIVFMGMGEPFANYREVMKSIDILTDPNGYNFGARRITISTVGLVPMIEKFTGKHSQINLAISLHAAENALRESMLPINKKYPLEVLIPACRQYTEKTRRRISFEWAMINSVNDTPGQAKLLVKLLKGMLCHVNLIPLNPTHGYDGRESSRENISKFRGTLDKAGIPNTLRIRRGIDIHAGCGQLRQAQQPTPSLPRGG